ncbi:ExeA family protein [Bordetella bronchiseptica]|uniref:ExeA family protein n=1 Tax=Bordetella bronchiseptica TaxID=518 RepID=UPI000460E837|nr:AAA family ATPase [Bordetella bronchiseptica]KDC65734.1 AAA domain protein [Bordetella bronchiseptica MBORD591]
MLKLKKILADLHVEQAELAEQMAYSQATISQLVNHSVWPKRAARWGLRERILKFLKERGANDDQVATAFEEWTPTRGNASESGSHTPTGGTEDEAMSIRKQILHPNTRRHFKLPGDPFEEVASAEEFYQNEHIRFTRAAMLDAAKRGGFLAVVGESGSGKTTMRRDLQERIERESIQVQVIRPYVVAMEDNDDKGKTLKAAHIAEAIMAAVAPHEVLKTSSEARFRQVEKALKESYRTGMRHVVLIEEAHAMPLATLRHLKRFIELEDGFTRLLSVILIGQTELAIKLNPKNATVREVVQRCELITLPPLGQYLEDYLKFRFARLGVQLDQVVTLDGVQAIRSRLEPEAPRGHEERSFLYPLAVHNLLTAAMNLAAENGAPAVSADIVMEAKWN